jgi:hypothetical protein
VTLINMLRAVAELTDAQQSVFSQQRMLPPGCSSGSLQARQQSAAAAAGRGQQPQQQQQQEARQPHGFPLPPLPPGAWIASALERLLVSRSVLAEVALWHALEAAAQLLQRHPERQQLLQRQSQEQQQQQPWYWWRHLDTSSEAADAAADAAAAAAAAAAAGVAAGAAWPAWLPPPVTAEEQAEREFLGTGAADVHWDPTRPFDERSARIAVKASAAQEETAGQGWPGNFSTRRAGVSKGQHVLQQEGILEDQDAAGRDWRAGTWLYAPAGSSSGDARGSSVSAGSGGGVFASLTALVACLGAELGSDAGAGVEQLVEEAAAVAR